MQGFFKKLVLQKCDDNRNGFQHIGEAKENVEQTVIQNEEDQVLASAVMDLPIKYREVIYLYYFEELPIKEISAVIRSQRKHGEN